MLKMTDQVYVGKLFTSTTRFGVERSEGPNWVASEKFNMFYTRNQTLCCFGFLYYDPSLFLYPSIKIILTGAAL
jgi:hypothetical protein